MWSSSCEACHNRQGATEGAMRVWIPFSPAQHLDCGGCLVTRTEHLSENTSSRHLAVVTPRHAARAHTDSVHVFLYRCVVSSKFYHVDTRRKLAERNFSNISGAGSIVSQRMPDAAWAVSQIRRPAHARTHADRVAIAPTRAGRRNARTRHHRIAWIYVLVPRRAVSGPKTARRTRTAPGGNALYRGGRTSRP